MSAAATETSCLGDTSMKSTRSRGTMHDVAGVTADHEIFGQIAVVVDRRHWPGRHGYFASSIAER